MNRIEIKQSLTKQVTEKSERKKTHLKISHTVYPTGIPQYSKVGGAYQWYGISQTK